MKTLIACPHPDDEVLGCASFLDAQPIVLYITANHPQYKEILGERERLIRETELQPAYWDSVATNRLDAEGAAHLINVCENALNRWKPDLVLVPSPSYNQDHRAVYDAMLTACRPHDRNWWPKRVLAYEEPETFGSLRQPPAFRPTYFRHLDIERKLALYRIYASQVRGHRSEDDLRAIAHVRGMQSGMENAEAFEVLRWVE